MALWRPQLCEVSVIYACPACKLESALPALCCFDESTGVQRARHAYGLCPVGDTLNPPEEARHYSSVWEGDAAGTGHARSMLDSQQAWSAQRNHVGEWMVMDAGSEMRLVGVVVAGRGHSGTDQVVEKLRMDVSNDGSTWREVSEARGVVTGLVPDRPTRKVNLLFATEVSARYVRLTVLAWRGHISLRAGLLLAKPAAAGHVRRQVLDASQLPTTVPATFMPRGAPPPRLPPPAGTGALAVMPSGAGEWEGRRCSWEVTDFNGHANTRVVLVRPGDPCSISVRYHATWDYNSSDYCPGCIVQLYFGLGHPQDVPHAFSTGVVEHGIHEHRGVSTSTFDAPRTPGVYYITQTIGLDFRSHTMCVQVRVRVRVCVCVCGRGRVRVFVLPLHLKPELIHFDSGCSLWAPC